MKLVLDTNVLISALLKDSVTRKLIIEIDEDLVYSELGIAEIHKHKKLIMDRSGLSEEKFNSILDILLSYIELIPEATIKEKLKEAREIMQKIDERDVIFIATALVFDNSVVWSDDKDFKLQKRIPVKTTSEIINWVGAVKRKEKHSG